MARMQYRFPQSTLVVLGVFAAVACGLLLVGAFTLLRGEPAVSQLVEPLPKPPEPAPTVEEYERSVSSAVAPFFGRVASFAVADFSGDTADIRAIVVTAQNELLSQRVPAERRDTHLALVLLLEQWKRALDGSVPDQQPSIDAAAALKAAQPMTP